jgi:hypothetical protein
MAGGATGAVVVAGGGVTGALGIPGAVATGLGWAGGWGDPVLVGPSELGGGAASLHAKSRAPSSAQEVKELRVRAKALVRRVALEIRAWNMFMAADSRAWVFTQASGRCPGDRGAPYVTSCRVHFASQYTCSASTRTAIIQSGAWA